ncbi:helix-turn-helix domain-containing protein [Bacteroidales bacterium OttesenSCG-928-I14]|nr:helix-turn-helix domain-containing protein [Bacteroidales bacterium OttesenSCG-928-I14]
MYSDNDFTKWLQEWFERFLKRFDRLDGNLQDLSGRYNFLDGERLLDNQDLCQLLHVSKRTLQRYRSSGELLYETIYHKTYYRESDVEAFIEKNFSKGKKDEEGKDDLNDNS